jgi:hypothetical protein
MVFLDLINFLKPHLKNKLFNSVRKVKKNY